MRCRVVEPAIDDLLADGTITEEADRYRAAFLGGLLIPHHLVGEEATPTFSGLDA